jgi:hypothetical protein
MCGAYQLTSAHACSEIGLNWLLFALHDLGTALGFVSVIDFSGDFVSSNTGETGKRARNIFLPGIIRRSNRETWMDNYWQYRT